MAAHDETPGRAANPNGESEQGLAGDMGLSSERTGPFPGDGVEGTGSSGTAQGRTDGDAPTHPDQVEASTETHRQVQEAEENPDPVASHDDVRAANPRPTREDRGS